MSDGSPRVDTPYRRPAAMPPLGSVESAADTEGVLGRRLFAYLIDIVFVFGFMLLLGLVISILGVFTFGLAWGLFVLIVPGAAILYSMITVGGPSQATIGMRMMGLRVLRAADGGRVDWISAGVHALLFYVAAGTFVLWALDLVIGMARGDRRLGHDLLVGLAVVRR